MCCKTSSMATRIHLPQVGEALASIWRSFTVIGCSRARASRHLLSSDFLSSIDRFEFHFYPAFGADLIMLENEVNKHSELHPSSSSSSEVTDYETDNADKERVYDEVYKAILDELVDDAMWELCFEVHKAVKLGYFFLDPDPEKKKYLEEAEKDIFGQRLKSKVPTYQISCPICKNKSCATKYASHLAKCIGISGRNSSRAATRKMAADLDENDSDSDSSVSASRKKSKKTHGKKTQKKSKVRGSSSKTSLENANFEDMTYEERKQFFKQKCGVITKTNKMCMNSHKCSQHTDEEKREIRHCLLRDMGEQLTSDGQIDVDTVDEGNCGYFFS